jgi:hypothetical protein
MVVGFILGVGIAIVRHRRRHSTAKRESPSSSHGLAHVEDVDLAAPAERWRLPSRGQK